MPDLRDQYGLWMSKLVSPLNTEFDSRILRVSTGYGGVTRPTFARAPLVKDPGQQSDRRDWGDAAVEAGVFQRVYCVHCGKPGGAVSSDIPAVAKGMPGVLYVCPECDGRLGPLPVGAIGFVRRD